MFDRRLFQYFDWWLMGLTLILCSIGLTIIYSAVTAGESDPQRVLWVKQGVWYAIGLTAMIVTFIVNYKVLDKLGGGIYAISVILLILVLLAGKHVGGSTRWLVVGPVTIQPSELAKIAVIIVMAKFYAKRAKVNGFRLKELFIPALIVAVPFLLIVKQPDLGTAVLVLFIAASMTIYVKIERRSLVYIISFCTVTVPMIWFLLADYQKKRILTFLDPDRDPLGTGYHIIQSKIAIGSGMIFGKGFLKGTQNALSFLPEQHTDFIISVLAEEWGFFGTGFVLFLYMILILWGLNIALGCRDAFGTILAVGVSAMIFWEIFINAGMVMGLMPVVGVPLPLISYGGSSVITTMIGIGILISISMRRFVVE